MPSIFLPSVVAHLRHHAETTPNKTALIIADSKFSYADLWARSISFAAALDDAGVSYGDRVLLHATHSFSYVSAYFATTILGAVAVPYEEGLPQEAVIDLARRVEAKAAVSPVAMSDVAVTFSAEDVLAASGQPKEIALPAAHDMAEFLLTTGTTGRSKVVELSHGAVMAVVENISSATDIQEDNVSLVPMPLNHVFALRRLQTGLVAGATVVLINGIASLKKFYHAIEAHGVTSLSLVPSALAYVNQTTKDLIGKYDGQIRFVESSSAPLPSSTRGWLRSVLPSARLYNSYGCTESTACCMLEYSHREDDGSCVGAPCSTAFIRILDPFTGDECVEGSGRIAIGGGALMSGYWNDPVATAVTLHDDVVYTNDLGFMADGELYVQGRLDDVAIIGGHNVSPSEVEDVIVCNDLVSDCACVKTSDSLTGDALVLFVVWRGVVEIDALLAYMREHLESFKIPSVVRTLEEIPRTYNGKIDRKVLAKMLADECAREGD